MGETVISVPEITFPDWLPSEIRNTYESYLQDLAVRKNSQIDKAYGFARDVNIHTRDELIDMAKKDFEIAAEDVSTFIKDQTEHAWQFLFKKDQKKTIKFALYLTKIRPEFKFEQSTVKTLKAEEESFIKIFEAIFNLKQQLHQHSDQFDDGLISPHQYEDIMTAIDGFIDESPSLHHEFQEYCQKSASRDNNPLAISRKKNTDTASAIYAGCRISLFFS